LRKADKVICNSKVNAKQIENFANISGVEYVYNGYDIQRINELSNKTDERFDQFFEENEVFINVGRLILSKAQDFLLKVFQAVLEDRKCKLMLLGQGPYKKELIEVCKKLDLSVWDMEDQLPIHNDADIYFLGFQENPYYFISKSKSLLFPSFYEGLPNVPIESIFCKTNCILSDCDSGPREILLPDSNLNTKAKKPQKSKFGYLLPSFKANSTVNLDAPLTEEEEFWRIAILKSLEEPNSITAEDLLEFKVRFSQEECLNNWSKVLK